MRVGILLAGLLIAPCASAKDTVNYIGKGRPQCMAQFSKTHPDIAPVAARYAPAALHVKCGQSRGTAVFLDTPSRRVVVTAEHNAVNYSENKGKYKIDKVNNPAQCRLQHPVSKVWLPLDPAIPPILGHPVNRLNDKAPLDWMVLALKNPLEGVEPISMANPGDMGPGSGLLILGAIGWNGKDVMECKYVSRCTSRDAWRGVGLPSYHYTDCSTSSGQSGGPALLRDANGDYKAAAILTGSVVELPTGSPYDKDRMSTSLIGLDGSLLEAILTVEEKASGKSRTVAAVP